MLLSLDCYNKNMMTRFLLESYRALFRTFAETLPLVQAKLKYSRLLKVCLLRHRTTSIQQEIIMPVVTFHSIYITA